MLSKPPFEKSVMIGGEWLEAEELIVSADAPNGSVEITHVEGRFQQVGNKQQWFGDEITVGWNAGHGSAAYTLTEYTIYYVGYTYYKVENGVLCMDVGAEDSDIKDVWFRAYTFTQPQRTVF